ncbi:MAG TPA: hypothetical protein VFK05_20270 [Polyangiaceae bacterium]|nr:hypothetical protein [Polyangiaceae bacterium]
MSAHPVRWAEAAPSFFKRSEPGTWDPAKQKFEPLVGVPRLQALEGDLPQFQLLEFVEWDLQPLSKGGGLNVLEISEFKQTDTELAYRYRLIHCIQTKFLASWEPGGLDVDEGHYHAKWTRSAGGTLRIEAEKRLRYAREDEVMPGFSRMLNLLNPAMTSLLMSELAFYGVRDYLVGRPSPVRLALDKT